jgi:hypothetical protein
VDEVAAVPLVAVPSGIVFSSNRHNRAAGSRWFQVTCFTVATIVTDGNPLLLRPLKRDFPGLEPEKPTEPATISCHWHLEYVADLNVVGSLWDLPLLLDAGGRGPTLSACVSELPEAA